MSLTNQHCIRLITKERERERGNLSGIKINLNIMHLMRIILIILIRWSSKKITRQTATDEFSNIWSLFPDEAGKNPFVNNTNTLLYYFVHVFLIALQSGSCQGVFHVFQEEYFGKGRNSRLISTITSLRTNAILNSSLLSLSIFRER